MYAFRIEMFIVFLKKVLAMSFWQASHPTAHSRF